MKFPNCAGYFILIYLLLPKGTTPKNEASWIRPALGPVSRKPRKRFGPVKAFLVHLYLKTDKYIRLKLLV